jgi:hypothetical protein
VRQSLAGRQLPFHTVAYNCIAPDNVSTIKYPPTDDQFFLDKFSFKNFIRSCDCVEDDFPLMYFSFLYQGLLEELAKMSEGRYHCYSSSSNVC